MEEEVPMTSTEATSPKKPLAISNAFVEQRLASRLLLFCLLFEEMQLPCAKIVNSSNLLDKLVSMLQMVSLNSSNLDKPVTSTTLSSHSTHKTTKTPVWLTSLFILVDLIEKAALASKRKAAINEQFGDHTRQWKCHPLVDQH